MNPVVVLVPTLALLFGPRLWVGSILRKYNRRDEIVSTTARALARELLDGNGLRAVRVESTDIGDHYDPELRVVRISRDKIDRRTLTALTTASHEVAHAIQHASGYGPFVWRGRLVRAAQATGDAGAVLLLAAPVAALTNRSPISFELIAAAAIAMLGTSVVAQLAALPSELNASFARALPMLRKSRLSDEQLEGARSILLACSLTYVASSMVAILHVWPWLGRGPVVALPRAWYAQEVARQDGRRGFRVEADTSASSTVCAATAKMGSAEKGMEPSSMGLLSPSRRPTWTKPARRTVRNRKIPSVLEVAVRGFGKPLARCWLRATGAA